jgi:opacity protein-like surface antigen
MTLSKEGIMKKLIAAAALAVFCAAVAHAHDKVVVLPAKNGDVTFNHLKHKDVKGNCTACHENEKGGKIVGIGKDWAHKTCKGCHEEMKQGPTGCTGCHVKK